LELREREQRGVVVPEERVRKEEGREKVMTRTS